MCTVIVCTSPPNQSPVSVVRFWLFAPQPARPAVGRSVPARPRRAHPTAGRAEATPPASSVRSFSLGGEGLATFAERLTDAAAAVACLSRGLPPCDVSGAGMLTAPSACIWRTRMEGDTLGEPAIDVLETVPFPMQALEHRVTFGMHGFAIKPGMPARGPAAPPRVRGPRTHTAAGR